jgi:SAM-dependent methyltransferase
MTGEIDPIWEQTYAQGHGTHWPWDPVVTFVFRNRPRDRVGRLLELGCGVGANLRFAAKEGLEIAGLDGSPSAISRLAQLLAAEGRSADLRVGVFPTLPWPDGSFDLVIDRAALTCVGRAIALQTLEESWRVLRPGGRFFMNVYADDHRSASSGELDENDLRHKISAGTLVGAGALCFWSEAQLRAAFAARSWRLLQLDHVVHTALLSGGDRHTEWRLVAERAP